MSKAKSSNQAKAKKCAEFVEAMRAAFGEVKVLYVEENGLKLGEKNDDGYVPATAIAADAPRAPVLEKKAA